MPARRPAPAALSRRRALGLSLAGLGGLALLGPRPVAAQSDWLEKGTEALKGLTGEGGGAGLSDAKIGRGLKQALEVASRSAVDTVGRPGGYLDDDAIHIPLPGYLADVQSALSAVGAAGMLDEVERRLNRGAEAAAPEAEALFLDAIGEMTLADARSILDGPKDAATRYFRRTMTPGLKRTFRPIVDRELADAGAISAFERVDSRLGDIPFAPSLGANAKDRLVDHGLEGALDGLFHYLAKEEAAIRENPAKRTTDLLREVFG